MAKTPVYKFKVSHLEHTQLVKTSKVAGLTLYQWLSLVILRESGQLPEGFENRPLKKQIKWLTKRHERILEGMKLDIQETNQIENGLLVALKEMGGEASTPEIKKYTGSSNIHRVMGRLQEKGLVKRDYPDKPRTPITWKIIVS